MLRRIIVSVASILAASACSNGTTGLNDAGGPPADSGVTVADAGSNPDAGPVDSGPPPLRRLVDQKLFGDLPLDNLVLDPQLDLGSQNWFAIGGFANNMPRTVRPAQRVLARSPASQPALAMFSRSNDPPDTFLLGSVMAAPAPLTASVWLGRDAAGAMELANAKPSLVLSKADTGEEAAYDLMPETLTSSRTIDGIVWLRYSATITDASAGLVTFAVQDPPHTLLYVHAPVVRSGHALRLESRAVRGRTLEPPERQAMRAMSEWRRQRLGSRAQTPEPEGPTLYKKIGPAKEGR
jgi:hypothetical protein